MVVFILAAASISAYAQTSDVVQRSSSPLGMRIQGGAQGSVQQSGMGALTSGMTTGSDGNAATAGTAATANSAGNTQIQGNTAIKAGARNLSSTATGRSSAAGNEVGVIGK